MQDVFLRVQITMNARTMVFDWDLLFRKNSLQDSRQLRILRYLFYFKEDDNNILHFFCDLQCENL